MSILKCKKISWVDYIFFGKYWDSISWAGTFKFASTYYMVNEVSNIRVGFNYWFKYYGITELRLLNSYLTSNSEITIVGRWITYCLGGLKPLYVREKYRA